MRIHTKAALIIGLLCSASAMAQSWSMAELMQSLAQQKSGKASFVEKKYIGFIDQPIESSGELSFTAPDRLEKRTLLPKQESLVLEGDTLTIAQADKRPVRINLQAHPEAAAFVESIRGTLAGDRAALEKFYRLELSGASDKWQLVLVPLQARMLKIVQRIRIEGTQSVVRRIVFEQADGDRSDMQISKVSEP